ncbi:MAG: nucleoside triphosphate pyrophosphohydrolase [Spirochaetaceae bacterium]
MSDPGRKSSSLPVPPYRNREITRAGIAFDYFYEIISLLMGPDGCPWDREQTPESMRRHLLEETLELIEAIDNRDGPHIDEEIGDVYLVVSMVLRMRELEAKSSAEAVLEGLAEKLVRRHPHVFAAAEAPDSRVVKEQWDRIKREVEGKLPEESLADEHKGFPPLARAYKLQKKAAKRGFDWSEPAPVLDKLREEIDEIEEALFAEGRDSNRSGQSSMVEEEVGDLLFSVVNLSRKLGVDPSLALERSTRKFSRRFDAVRSLAGNQGVEIENAPLEKLDELWEAVKREEPEA